MTSDLIASGSGHAISQHCRVTLHFSLLLDNGEEIDTTRGRKQPVTFTMGDGNLLPGFEQALKGLRAGDARQLKVPAESAFGERNDANIQVLGREMFRDLEDELEEGMIVSFQGPGGELPGVVLTVFDDTLKVDFNHPLSGKDIIFDVAIVEVEPLN